MVSTPEPVGAVCTGQTDRRPKHVEIHSAIGRISMVSERLDVLMERITETSVPRDPEVSAKEGPPSLEQVLNSGPDRINFKIDEMLRKIDTITELLF